MRFFGKSRTGNYLPRRQPGHWASTSFQSMRKRGSVEVEFEGKDEFTNPAGKIQGGFLAAMLDDTMGPALAATLLAGEFAPTLNLNVQFLSPAVPGKLHAVGRVVRRGGEVCFLSDELSQGGRVVATTTATAIIRKL